MKRAGFLSVFLVKFCCGHTQPTPRSLAGSRKGEFFAAWGWNREWYTKSDITLKGDTYDFTLRKVVAKDRQDKLTFDNYLNPGNITIPQFNFKIGYFINDKYTISLGTDHMKYVVQADQVVKISGNISNSGTPYDGVYSNQDIAIAGDFLKFEHTDGLNYINSEFRRFDELFSFHHISLSLTEGLGAGFLLPRTNVTLLNNQRHDEFHLSGYGVSAVMGGNITFYKHFFIQSEFKEGFINMPDIRTTRSSSDKASQHFFFTQFNVALGANFRIGSKNHKNAD